MKFNLLKTMLVAVGMVMSTGAWAEVGDKATIVDQTFTSSTILTSTDAYTWGSELSDMLTDIGLYVTNGSNIANYENRDFLTFTNVVGDDAHEVNVSYEVYSDKDKGQPNTYYTISYFNNDGDFVFAVQEYSGGWKYGCNVIYATESGENETAALPGGHLSKAGGKVVNLTVKFSGETAVIRIDDHPFAAYTKSAGIKAVKLSVTGENGYDRDMYIKNYKVETTEIEVETYYRATFTESAGLAPVVTVYTDADHKNEISAASLSANTTYYYVATLVGYEDYAGSFEVKEENPVVEFTMVEKPKFAYSINLVDENDEIIKTLYENDEVYEGMTFNYSYPKYLTDEDGKVSHVCSLNSYNVTVAPTEAGSTNIKYTTYKGTAYFVEAETLNGLATKVEDSRLSGGSAARGASDKEIEFFNVKESAKYTLTYVVYSNNVNATRELSISKNGTNLAAETINWSINKVQSDGVKSIKNILLIEGDVVTFNPSDGNVVFDYAIIEKTGEATVAASVGESGFATFCPTVGVSFAGVENVEAYKATTVAEGVVNLTKVETVAAGEGVLLRSVEGGAATADVTVDAAAVKAEDNIFIGVTEPIGALASEVDGKTNYILNDGEFYKANDQEVAAGKAYLAVEGTSEAKSLKIAFGGDTTGISEVNSTKADGAYYSVSGVRVANPTKGLYIMNGKKVIVK